MKKFFMFLMAAAMLVSVNSCKDDDDPDPVPSTTKSFTAKIDGNSWTSSILVATVSTSTTLQIIAGTMGAETMQLVVTANGTGTYAMGNAAQGMVVSSGGNGFSTLAMDVPVGQVVITKYDLTAKVVSGTFSFDGEDDNGTIHHVTEGKFENIPLTIY